MHEKQENSPYFHHFTFYKQFEISCSFDFSMKKFTTSGPGHNTALVAMHIIDVRLKLQKSSAEPKYQWPWDLGCATKFI